jgi:hypothetical protein
MVVISLGDSRFRRPCNVEWEEKEVQQLSLRSPWSILKARQPFLFRI